MQCQIYKNKLGVTASFSVCGQICKILKEMSNETRNYFNANLSENNIHCLKDKDSIVRFKPLAAVSISQRPQRLMVCGY
jgi:DNA polymerase III delta prime subunit